MRRRARRLRQRGAGGRAARGAGTPRWHVVGHDRVTRREALLLC